MDANIKIVGLGEGGTKAINKMMTALVGKNFSAEFVAIGSDENILLTSAARKNIFLNRDPATVYKNISEALRGAKIIFIVAGLGSGAARISVPSIFSCAKNLGALSVAFVCKPSILENSLRKVNADFTEKNLRGKVDTLFVVPAEKFFMFKLNQPQVSLHELFDAADDFFCQGVKIFLDVISSDSAPKIFGEAALGFGGATNPLDAIKIAASFPTLDENEFKSAQKIFLRLESGTPLPLSSIDAAKNFFKAKLPPDAEFFLQEKIIPSHMEKIFAAIICTRKEEKR